MSNKETFVYVVNQKYKNKDGVFRDKESSCRYVADLVNKTCTVPDCRQCKQIKQSLVKDFLEVPEAESWKRDFYSIKKYPVQRYPGTIDV